MGRPAVKHLLLLAPLLGSLLGGCTIVSDVAGFAAGGAAGTATGNPVIGYAVGIGVRAGVDELRRYVVRRRQQGEQDAIADAAGAAPLGQSRPWEIRHTIPLGNEKGTLTPVRDIPNALAPCREILFSTEDGFFTAALCRGDGGWKWATAEPAVERWGYLQ